MLEGDHRRDRRHLRRAAQDLRAVDDVHAHDRELVVGQLVGLVQDLGRRAHLADVVHQRRQAELAQQRAVDAERARLRHRQDRHVHHVRERVVVVVLERGQRDQRGAVLRHRLRQRVDQRARRLRIGRAFGLGASPTPTPATLDGVGVEPADGGDVGGRRLDLLVGLDAADADVRQRCRARRADRRPRRPARPVRPALGMRDGQRQRRQLLGRDAAIEGDALDAERLAGAGSSRPSTRAARGSGMSPTMTSWPMMPIAIDG